MSGFQLSAWSACDLPATFSELRRTHVEEIIREFPPAVGNEATTNKLLVPQKNLNPNGLLLHNIFRLFEYPSNNNAMLNDQIEMKRRAFLLRKVHDGCFDDDMNRVFSQPKHDSSGFCGCSCTANPENQFTGEPFLYSLQMASVQNMTDDNFTAEMRKLRAGAIMGGPSNRIAVAFRLASREPVPENTWIVDDDEAGFPGHVTIAVCNGNGLPSVEEDFTFQNCPI